MTLLSPWGEKLNRDLPLPEYPRMQLQRNSYTCLNGVWECQINHGEEPEQTAWQPIVVPFAAGCALSGVTHELQPGEVLWYRTYFRYELTGERVILNFEAVDQHCTVWLNGLEAGSHHGGYTPFSLDVSPYIKVYNEMLVQVTDDSNLGSYAFGKQRLDHSGMWYTPTAGIWQTVWLENLPEHAVQDIKITPDYDNAQVFLRLAGDFSQAVVTVFADRKLVHRGITGSHDYTIPLPDFHPWSPDDPFLYDLYIETEDDTVKSYFGMRKFGRRRDSSGQLRFALNDRPLFLSGLLDQGYSVDGLLTYPSEDAMVYEIRQVKNLGFNMLRKHVKQECRRWYYLCDVYGLLVMQDMPNGGWPYDFKAIGALPTIGFRKMSDDNNEKLGRTDAEGKEIYYRELMAMLDCLYNTVSVFAWVPFNEGWGQFDSEKVTAYIREYDSTRLIDSASGWHDQGAGDFDSRHCYFRPFRAPKPEERLMFLSEFGGYSYLEQGHSEPGSVYGYKKFSDRLQWNEAVLEAFRRDVLKNIPKGLAGCIFTQVSDVEDEINGLFTADRRVLKIDGRKMRRINEKCIRSVK